MTFGLESVLVAWILIKLKKKLAKVTKTKTFILQLLPFRDIWGKLMVERYSKNNSNLKTTANTDYGENYF